MPKKKTSTDINLPLIRLKQWLPNWDRIQFNKQARQAKPSACFYLCAIRASHLKALTGVYRRSTKGGLARAQDPNVQRGHEEHRSTTIREYVRYGFPWCEMGENKRQLPGAEDLLKPGWLPTAIIVNILPPDTSRNGKRLGKPDMVTIKDDTNTASMRLPESFSGAEWEPKTIFPIEVIDGQHRLWAFEDFDPGEDYELPVVAFHGLDHSWQAYLFWSVNITPKRINRSLAFDLYPLLRQEDWLDKFTGHSIYRETRCQELVESLWGHPDSPWHQRINMLGETTAQLGSPYQMVSQAAWIRSLMASFVKQWDGSNVSIGGLFGAPRSADDPFLPWNRAMQAAFLIFCGQQLRDELKQAHPKWAEQLRNLEAGNLFDEEDDPAFYGAYSLIATDQGIRGILFLFNDLCYVRSHELKLEDWSWDNLSTASKKKAAATEEQAVSAACESLAQQPVASFVRSIAKGLITYDWRTSSTPSLSDGERLAQAVFRGSSGYKELRRQLLRHLASVKGAVGNAATIVADVLGYQ